MRFKILLILLLSALTQSTGMAQSYWVYFANKKNTTFDPYTYFDPKAIERRIINEVNLYDSTDFPLNQEYVTEVARIADSAGFQSRWFNALEITASEEQVRRIQQLPFVRSVEAMETYAIPASRPEDPLFDSILSPFLKQLLEWQTLRLGGPRFKDAGLNGKGVRIAVFDGGYPSLLNNAAFRYLVWGNRIIKTWDFVGNKENVYGYNPHGTLVLSCLTGVYDGEELGLASGAEYLLARTEVASEPYREEKNWLAALEWADRNGAQIINSSVGYTFHRYFQNELDGKTSLVARAANMAARKGILVVNCAGNEALGKWQSLCTPGDADSVLTVGGIDPVTGIHMAFSSYGPTADKRMKPNVCAFADVVAFGPHGVQNVQGTSFSCPLVAGFAACVLQANPRLKVMDLFHLIEQSGDLYPYFDYAHGYGVPQASRILDTLPPPQPTFLFVQNKENISLLLKDFKYSIDEPVSHLLLYYNIMNSEGYIEEYNVIMVYQNRVLSIPLDKYPHGKKLNVSFRGYTASYTF
jgi:subtilisin family serine protease